MLFRFTFLTAALLSVLAIRPSSADQVGFGVVYVSNGGNDANNCSTIASACASVAGALTRVYTGGTIVCVDNNAPGAPLTVAVSVTIECNGATVYPITINLPSNDTKQTVHLRGLTVNVADGNSNAIVITAAENVVLQDMVIEGATGVAVKDSRQSPGKLRIKDTVVNKNSGLGVVVAGATGNVAVFDNATLDSSSYGVAVAAGNRVSITRSSISGNSVAGVEADGGSLVIVDDSTIANNNVGVQSGSAVRLSNNNLEFNTTAVNGPTGTFGNNRFSGNGSDGTTLTPVGAGSTDLAQK